MGESRVGHHQYQTTIPLLHKQFQDLPLTTTTRRTGNVWTAAAHIITGVIGSGVLSLSWSVAQLGWIAGPFAIVAFALITLFSAFLLSDSNSDDSACYVDAVRTNLGTNKAFLCGLLLHLSLLGYGIAYTVTAAISMRSIAGECESAVYYIVVFGGVQVLLSQIPDFHNIQTLSLLAAVMSLAYALLGLGLAAATVLRNGHVQGTITGVPSTPNNKLWLISQALGDVAFSYPFSLILFEIQDTLKSPPPKAVTMKKASTISILLTTFFYLLCGGFGYAAFGDSTPGNLMTAFGANRPYWLVRFANACIVLHLVGGYQIYSQPLFASVEKWAAEKLPNSEFVTKNYSLKVAAFGELRVNLLRLCFRTAYVASTTAIAASFPYFNQVLGVLGGLNFWPMTIYFPVEMYLARHCDTIEPWTAKWVMFKSFSGVFLLVAVFALVGSVQGLLTQKLS